MSGGTTVSCTMIASHRAGIPVFVTGGVGGVHRHGHHSKYIFTCFLLGASTNSPCRGRVLHAGSAAVV